MKNNQSLPSGWGLTSAGGKKWVVYQDGKKYPHGYYKVFEASNYQTAKEIAKQIAQDFAKIKQ
nr:MAG TPA: hypothetical protein [Caudoviricetes sp.]